MKRVAQPNAQLHRSQIKCNEPWVKKLNPNMKLIPLINTRKYHIKKKQNHKKCKNTLNPRNKDYNNNKMKKISQTQVNLKEIT